MESTNRVCIETTEKREPIVVRDAVGTQQMPNVIIRHRTASEVFGLAFESCSGTHAQELSNEFARLLNRGSSLE